MGSIKSRISHVLGTVLAVGIIGVVTASTTIASTPPLPAVASAPIVNQNPYNHEPIETYTAQVRKFQESGERARVAVEESDGKVLDGTNRDALAAAGSELTQLMEEPDAWLVDRVDALIEIHEANQFPPLFFPYDVEKAESLAEQVETLLPKVAEDVTAWEAEQARLQAEREAQAAREAAARAAAQAQQVQPSVQRGSSKGAPARSGTTTAPATQSGGVAYSFSSIGAANQSAIDSCSGFGDTTGWLGVASFSVHWHCGGSRIANLSPGQTIRINNGQYAGVWQAQGLAYRLNGQVNTTRDVRRLGGLQIQTCIGGTYSNLGYYLFTRVG